MMALIGTDLLQKVFRINITTETEEQYQKRMQAQRERQKRDMKLGAAEAKPETVKREEKKVGRNDPCPCGSGKKYKKCHGASGMSVSA